MGDRIVHGRRGPGARRPSRIVRPALRTLVAAGGLIVLLGACSTSTAAERDVSIRIEHSRFVPETIEVEAGTTVRFVVVNDDPIDHEFIVGDAEIQKVHEEGTERHHGARPGEISIPASATRETTYTFEDPGTLIYGCHLPGHYDYGMRGTIEIH